MAGMGGTEAAQAAVGSNSCLPLTLLPPPLLCRGLTRSLLPEIYNLDLWGWPGSRGLCWFQRDA